MKPKRKTRKNKRKPRKASNAIWCGVIAKLPASGTPLPPIYASQRPTNGDWASVLGGDKESVIAEAIRLTRKWEANGYGPYEILAGQLTEKVFQPTVFKLVKV